MVDFPFDESEQFALIRRVNYALHEGGCMDVDSVPLPFDACSEEMFHAMEDGLVLASLLRFTDRDAIDERALNIRSAEVTTS